MQKCSKVKPVIAGTVEIFLETDVMLDLHELIIWFLKLHLTRIYVYQRKIGLSCNTHCLEKYR